ncbi:MAG: hypothetical protein U0232_24350 [Thermomicrobiales bacterium]
MPSTVRRAPTPRHNERIPPWRPRPSCPIPGPPPAGRGYWLDRFLRDLLGPEPTPRHEPVPAARQPRDRLSLVLPAHNEEDNTRP